MTTILSKLVLQNIKLTQTLRLCFYTPHTWTIFFWVIRSQGGWHVNIYIYIACSIKKVFPDTHESSNGLSKRECILRSNSADFLVKRHVVTQFLMYCCVAKFYDTTLFLIVQSIINTEVLLRFKSSPWHSSMWILFIQKAIGLICVQFDPTSITYEIKCV